MYPKYLTLGLVQRTLPLKMRVLAERALEVSGTNLSPGRSAGHRMLSLLLLIPVLSWVLSDSQEGFGAYFSSWPLGPEGQANHRGRASGWLTLLVQTQGDSSQEEGSPSGTQLSFK